VSDTLESVTFRNGNNIDTLVLLEYRTDIDGLFKVGFGEFDLVGNGTTVDLDFHEVCLLLFEAGFGELGVGKDSDNGTVLLDSL
jgi:hypothetical protein